jgi:hypothetical protein
MGILRNTNPASMAALLNGTPVLLGTVIATTTKNNHDTATPFNNTGDALKGKLLMLQPDAACYINFATTNAGTATTSAIKLAADERVVVSMTEAHGWVACVSASGTTNLRVWELR